MDEQQINAIVENNELEDLKQLNQVDMNQYAQQPIEMVKSPVKKKVEVIELAEEKIMREMREVKERKEEEKRRKEGLKKQMIVETQVNRVENDTSMSKGDDIDFNQYISQPGSRLEQPKERVELPTKTLR